MQENNKRCGARTRAETPCRNWAMPNGRCRMHGGMTPGGMALPQFKHGRYSKYLPARLVDRYQAGRSDPELLAMRDEIAALDARLSELLERVDSGESGLLWTSLRAAWTELQEARRAKDNLKLAAALTRVGDLIEQGFDDRAAWADVLALFQDRRRLVESERRRLVDLQQMITAEQAMVFLAAITDAVKKHVDDRDTLAAISADLIRLTVAPSR